MEDHPDIDDLRALNGSTTLSEKLHALHRYLKKRFHFLDHISVAVHDSETDILTTLLDSSGDGVVMSNYQSKLGDSTGLKQVFLTGKPRIIDNLDVLSNLTREYSKRILDAGYRSSYTMPMYYKEKFFGFVFFNSSHSHSFKPDIISHLNPFGRLLALIVMSEIRDIKTLVSATKTVRHITSSRDSETGAHLERMSRYSRLISRHIADIYDLSDEYIEYISLFSPLHDIGKIAIPDSILLKPGTLNDEEYRIIMIHCTMGLEIINSMLIEFDLINLALIDILRNIVYHHHEHIDGSGYPDGLKGEAIPIEARVVATADVFDALTSNRPYKQAWDNDRAFAELERIAGRHLDQHCVTAMREHRSEVEQFQQQFRENNFG